MTAAGGDERFFAIRELLGDKVFVAAMMMERSFSDAPDEVGVEWGYEHHMGGPMIVHLVIDHHAYRIEVERESETAPAGLPFRDLAQLLLRFAQSGPSRRALRFRRRG